MITSFFFDCVPVANIKRKNESCYLGGTQDRDTSLFWCPLWA